ncbi:MAG TPA: serine--tRNA ligase [Actinomycetota bacterium]|jgi:seryl-tRNA synthetase
MIDSRLVLDDFETTARQLGRKGVERATLEELREVLEARRRLVRDVGERRSEMNRGSQEIGQLLAQGRTGDADERRHSIASLKDRIRSLDAELREVEARVTDRLLRIPNLPAADSPDGKGEEDNVVLRVHGHDPGRYDSRTWEPHWDIASRLGLWDPERSAKLSGAMFSVLRGDGARLLRSLALFALDLNRDRYEEILPPHFVRGEIMVGTGHLPKFEEEAYRLRDDDLWAIPTGEVPLMGLHRGEILPEAELPKRYMTYTVCWRREAGAAGKDTRGLQRLHEFHKVELLKLCLPEQEQEEFETLLADAERPLRLLGLPYRVVDLCTADLTFASARVQDLEVYSPGLDRWLEVSSVGLFTDFQARRGNIRFRRGDGRSLGFVHSLNGSGLATPRVWAAILEHGLQPDGSVRLPDVLVPYMGRDTIG